jgi:hypothetical protein
MSQIWKILPKTKDFFFWNLEHNEWVLTTCSIFCNLLHKVYIPELQLFPECLRVAVNNNLPLLWDMSTHVVVMLLLTVKTLVFLSHFLYQHNSAVINRIEKIGNTWIYSSELAVWLLPLRYCIFAWSNMLAKQRAEAALICRLFNR